MKKLLSSVFIAILIMNLPQTTYCLQLNSINQQNNDSYLTETKQNMLCLMLAYPESITGIEKSKDSNMKYFIILKSGKKILYDDKRTKNLNEMLSNPDLQDMFVQSYPLNSINDIMPDGTDPGRIRVYPLLYEVYGNTKHEVELNLTNVNIGSRNCQFNKKNNAAQALKNVFSELIPLARQRRDISSCLYPDSGTYNYRLIAGTGLLSSHAFGITIDLARDNRDYWKWTSKDQGRKRLLSYPKEIVEVFEKNNFVWGGKWNHFDILHFEYRPEIILKAKYFGSNQQNSPWYAGLPKDNPQIKLLIEKVNTEVGDGS